MSPEVRQLLEEWADLGEPGSPLFPDRIYELRKRTRRLLGTPAEGFQPGDHLTNAGAPSTSAAMGKLEGGQRVPVEESRGADC